MFPTLYSELLGPSKVKYYIDSPYDSRFAVYKMRKSNQSSAPKNYWDCNNSVEMDPSNPSTHPKYWTCANEEVLNTILNIFESGNYNIKSVRTKNNQQRTSQVVANSSNVEESPRTTHRLHIKNSFDIKPLTKNTFKIAVVAQLSLFMYLSN